MTRTKSQKTALALIASDDARVAAQSVAPVSDAPQEPVGCVPDAHGDCTDQRNAKRLETATNGRLRALAGQFFIYTGTHWRPDASEAAQYGATLNRIIGQEIDELRTQQESVEARLGPVESSLHAQMKTYTKPVESRPARELADTVNGPALLKLEARIKALSTWQQQCAMRRTQSDALGLLRSLVTLLPEDMDKHRHLFNCANGTVDLRTGQLQPHNPDDFISQIAPTNYDPDAKAPRFEQFVREIMDGDAEMASFLQRSLGYSLTGETREQKFWLHTGGGSNGKSLLFEAVELAAGVSSAGGYVHTVPSTLLISEGSAERHPTEVADLRARRMCIASETEDGAHLRETLLKNITGDDTLSGRFMHGNFFQFKPQAKLHLRTNKLPIVKNQEFATWRRILLVDYPVTFGSEEDIKAGPATKLRDNTLAAQLRAEREGILNWLVRGAVEYYAHGLNVPAKVAAAARHYQREQDRVAEFVRQRCVLDPRAWIAVSDLYPGYLMWCRENLYQPLGKGRFLKEMQRVVPEFKPQETRRKVGNDWRTMSGAHGVRLDYGTEFTPVIAAGEDNVVPIRASHEDLR
jgi:putative DNA primase/helicase